METAVATEAPKFDFVVGQDFFADGRRKCLELAKSFEQLHNSSETFFFPIVLEEVVKEANALLKQTGEIDRAVDQNIEHEPLFFSAKEVRRMVGDVTWAWEGWMPNGMLTVLAGEQNQGKSALALRLAGCFTEGWDWPDGTPFTGEKGLALWIECEGFFGGYTQRMDDWSMDLNKIVRPLKDELATVDLDSKEHRDRIVAAAHDPRVKFVWVDSLRAGTRRDMNAGEIIALSKFFAELAAITGKPILVLVHFKKATEFNSQANLDRVSGSGSITQPARSVIALYTPDKFVKERVCLESIKNNFGLNPAKIGMTWTGNLLTFGEAPIEHKSLTAVEQGMEILKELLYNGPVPEATVEEEAAGAGISMSSMKEAKRRMGIEAKRMQGHWFWRYPPIQGTDDM